MGASDTVSLMKESQQYIAANQIDVDEVDDITAELMNEMDTLEEVNNLIAEHGSTGLEEDEVMDEVDQWLDGESEEEEEDEEVDVDLPEPQVAVGAGAAAMPAVPTTQLPAVEQVAAAPARSPARVAVAVGAGGATASAPADDDEAELAAFFND